MEITKIVKQRPQLGSAGGEKRVTENSIRPFCFCGEKKNELYGEEESIVWWLKRAVEGRPATPTI